MTSWLVALRILSVAVSGVFASLALVTDYKDHETKRMTKWGRVALWGVVVSIALSIGSLLMEATQNSQRDRSAAADARAAADTLSGIITMARRTAVAQGIALRLSDSTFQEMRALGTSQASEVEELATVSRHIKQSANRQQELLDKSETLLVTTRRLMSPLRDLDVTGRLRVACGTDLFRPYVSRLHSVMKSRGDTLGAGLIKDYYRPDPQRKDEWPAVKTFFNPQSFSLEIYARNSTAPDPYDPYLRQPDLVLSWQTHPLDVANWWYEVIPDTTFRLMLWSPPVTVEYQSDSMASREDLAGATVFLRIDMVSYPPLWTGVDYIGLSASQGHELYVRGFEKISADAIPYLHDHTIVFKTTLPDTIEWEGGPAPGVGVTGPIFMPELADTALQRGAAQR